MFEGHSPRLGGARAYLLAAERLTCKAQPDSACPSSTTHLPWLALRRREQRVAQAAVPRSLPVERAAAQFQLAQP